MDIYSVNWGSVAEWVSGIGSLAAVITALYLASSSRRVRLDGYCGLRRSIGGGMPEAELLYINVRNIGSRSTIVNNIGIRIGLIKKRYAILAPPRDRYSDGIPKALGDGEEAHWAIVLDEEDTWVKKLCKGFVKSGIDVWTLRFQIHTTNGGSTNIRPEKELRDKILKCLGRSEQTQNDV